MIYIYDLSLSFRTVQKSITSSIESSVINRVNWRLLFPADCATKRALFLIVGWLAFRGVICRVWEDSS